MCHFSILQILFCAVIRYNNTHQWNFFTSLKRNCANKSTLHIHTHMVAYRTLTQISLWLFCVFLLNESDRYYSSSRECVYVCAWRTLFDVRIGLEACVLAVGKKRKSMCAKRKSNSEYNSILIFLCSYNRNMIQYRLYGICMAIIVIGPLCHIHLNTEDLCIVKIVGDYFS